MGASRLADGSLEGRRAAWTATEHRGPGSPAGGLRRLSLAVLASGERRRSGRDCRAFHLQPQLRTGAGGGSCKVIGR
jgi:hypothetical protein